MPIPRYDDIFVPALEILKSGDSIQKGLLEAPLAKHFDLGTDDLVAEYESGNGKIFKDRISWALSYLIIAGLLERPKRAHYQISGLGLRLLETPEKIGPFVSEALATREKSRRKSPAEPASTSQQRTPQEELYSSAEEIRGTTEQEILDLVLSKSPREFENLVVALLQKMGYGGEVRNAGEVTSYSNDGGIDGIIKEDVLGLGRIHIQAKRYKPENKIDRESVQKFVGALATAQSNKGVFITTSGFSRPALEYCESLNGATTVVLIDGQRLAELIYEYGPGMQIEQTIVLKKIDSEFWDAMDDQ